MDRGRGPDGDRRPKSLADWKKAHRAVRAARR